MICPTCDTDATMMLTVLEYEFLHECTECGWHNAIPRTSTLRQSELDRRTNELADAYRAQRKACQSIVSNH